MKEKTFVLGLINQMVPWFGRYLDDVRLAIRDAKTVDALDIMDRKFSALNDEVKEFLFGIHDEVEKIKIEPYRTPQWHYVVLWAGFMFITGMLLGAGLTAA
ncbi:MAG: hypothetical protein H6937_08945 [Burkholderiales bacterium]|nr:hypothetical protein [Burkholderiales bacterium]